MLFRTDQGRRGAVIIEPEGGHYPLELSPPDLKKLVQGVIWRDEHFDGMPLKDIAAREQCSIAYVGTAIHKSLEINAPA